MWGSSLRNLSSDHWPMGICPWWVCASGWAWRYTIWQPIPLYSWCWRLGIILWIFSLLLRCLCSWYPHALKQNRINKYCLTPIFSTPWTTSYRMCWSCYSDSRIEKSTRCRISSSRNFCTGCTCTKSSKIKYTSPTRRLPIYWTPYSDVHSWVSSISARLLCFLRSWVSRIIESACIFGSWLSGCMRVIVNRS